MEPMHRAAGRLPRRAAPSNTCTTASSRPEGKSGCWTSAGYSALVIRNAISIINDGVGVAGISAPFGDAIDIQAGSTDAIFIKGLSLDGAKTGGNGINLISAGNLTVANCTITGSGFSSMYGSGLFIVPSSGTVRVLVIDSIFSGNNYAGISIWPGYPNTGTTSVGAVLKNVALNNNASYGLLINGSFTTGTVSATIEDSSALNNQQTGASLRSGNATLIANRSNFSDNVTDGLIVDGGNLYLANSIVTGNYFGIAGSGYTFQNNIIRGNHQNVDGALTPISVDRRRRPCRVVVRRALSRAGAHFHLLPRHDFKWRNSAS
jgi:hypothetical protein